MDDQYPKLVVESQLARRRLAQAFEPGADAEIERQFLPVSDRTLATVAQKNHYKEEASIGDPVQRSTMSFVHSATIRTTVTLGDEFEEGEISFTLSLQPKTSCLPPFHSTTLGPQRSKSAWSGPELGESSDNGDVIASSYCSRRSDHRVNPGTGELTEIADLHPIVANERPKNLGLLG